MILRFHPCIDTELCEGQLAISFPVKLKTSISIHNDIVYIQR